MIAEKTILKKMIRIMFARIVSRKPRAVALVLASPATPGVRFSSR